MNRTVRVVATKQFEEALKALKKNHKTQVLRKLDQVVKDLIDLKITTQHQNHTLTNAEGHRDIHLEGKRIILMYRYDYASDNTDDLLLFITLRLQDMVDHIELKRYDSKKFSSPVHEFDPKDILSGTEIIEKGRFIF